MLRRIPINRKLPLAQMLIRKLFERHSEGHLDKLRILCLIVMGFFAFLRWDDLSQLRVSDIHLRSDHAAVFLEKRKMVNTEKVLGFWLHGLELFVL